MITNNFYLLDSSVFISKYLLEDDSRTCGSIINDCGKGYTGYISILSLGEIVNKILNSVKDKIERIAALESFFSDIGKFIIVNLDSDVRNITDKLREKDIWFEGYHDPLILSCGIYKKCTVFITKDKNIISAHNKIRNFAYEQNGIRMEVTFTKDVQKYSSD